MRSRGFIAGFALLVVPLIALAKAPAPQVPLEKALTMPAGSLAALCSDAAVRRRFVELARVGAVVVVGGRRVTASNADSVAAGLDAQIDVCRKAAEQRGVSQLQGDWIGQSTGCDRSASGLATFVAEPDAVVGVQQDGMSLTLSLSGRAQSGEPYSLPASGTVIEQYVVVMDPMNSDYSLGGEFADSKLVLRPDSERILAAWPKGANPPTRADLDSCVVTLERRAPESTP